MHAEDRLNPWVIPSPQTPKSNTVCVCRVRRLGAGARCCRWHGAAAGPDLQPSAGGTRDWHDINSREGRGGEGVRGTGGNTGGGCLLLAAPCTRLCLQSHSANTRQEIPSTREGGDPVLPARHKETPRGRHTCKHTVTHLHDALVGDCVRTTECIPVLPSWCLPNCLPPCLSCLCVCPSVFPPVLPLSHQVVLYTQEDVVQRVQELTGGKGVKVVFDGGALAV